MKHYVDLIQKGTKKVPLPVAQHLIQAVGALTLHTGRNYMYSHGHKKCPQQIFWRAFSPVSNVEHCKYEDYFLIHKLFGIFFEGGALSVP